MLFPYRIDHHKQTLPVVTLLFCLLLVFVFYQQQNNRSDIQYYAEQYCKNHRPGALLTVLKASTGPVYSSCPQLFASIHSSYLPNSRIATIANSTGPISGYSLSDGKRYIAQRLASEYRQFTIAAPENVSRAIAFYPDKPFGPALIAASFAHLSWPHLLGNLAFFLVFGAAVESIVGHFKTWLFILILAAGSHILYFSLSRSAPLALPSVGFSGVIMGLIAFLAILKPSAKVYFMTFLLTLWRPSLPVWLLATGYTGWDLFQHFAGSSTGVNYAAHLGGAALGGAVGLLPTRLYQLK